MAGSPSLGENRRRVGASSEAGSTRPPRRRNQLRIAALPRFHGDAWVGCTAEEGFIARRRERACARRGKTTITMSATTPNTAATTAKRSVDAETAPEGASGVAADPTLFS